MSYKNGAGRGQRGVNPAPQSCCRQLIGGETEQRGHKALKALPGKLEKPLPVGWDYFGVNFCGFLTQPNLSVPRQGVLQPCLSLWKRRGSFSSRCQDGDGRLSGHRAHPELSPKREIHPRVPPVLSTQQGTGKHVPNVPAARVLLSRGVQDGTQVVIPPQKKMRLLSPAFALGLKTGGIPAPKHPRSI